MKPGLRVIGSYVIQFHLSFGLVGAFGIESVTKIVKLFVDFPRFISVQKDILACCFEKVDLSLFFQS